MSLRGKSPVHDGSVQCPDHTRKTLVFNSGCEPGTHCYVGTRVCICGLVTGVSGLLVAGILAPSVPGKGPVLQLSYKHRGPRLHRPAAIVRLCVVMPVPVVTVFHWEDKTTSCKTPQPSESMIKQSRYYTKFAGV